MEAHPIPGLLVGADPEVFVANTRGRIVSAHRMIPGTKKEPHPVECGAVQVDGMALEFNINPASTEDEFVHNVQTVMEELRKMIPRNYSLVTQPVAHFGEEYIQKQPKVARELGCEPDYNAYSGGLNPTPNEGTPFRTAAGHLHIGWTDIDEIQFMSPAHTEACKSLCKTLDCVLGATSVAYDRAGGPRRILYGGAGAFRPKAYGVEYRTLSNFWLSTEERMRWVYRGVHNAWWLRRNGWSDFRLRTDKARNIIDKDACYQSRRWTVPAINPRIRA